MVIKMRSKIKILIVILILILVSVGLPIHAAVVSMPSINNTSSQPVGNLTSDTSNYEKAIDLKVLGLLNNKPVYFELDRAPTRAEGTAMLIRLLGKEYQVRQGSYSHPFTDVPSWANNYVGYAYQNGITKGNGNGSFGANELLSAKQYVTFVLRSMGYQDNIDFSYDNALAKAREIGLLSDAELSDLLSRPYFLRSDLVAVSHNALKVKIKGSSRTLAEKLVDIDKAIFRPAAEIMGFYPSEFQKHYGDAVSFTPRTTANGYVIKNYNDLVRLLTKTLINFSADLELDITGYSGDVAQDYKEAFSIARTASEKITGVNDFVKSWKYNCSSRSMQLTLEFRYPKSEYDARRARVKAAIDEGRYIVAENISMDMSEFEKEKNLHDYIVNNTRYDYDNYLTDKLPDYVFEEYGCLVSGYAVCEGYAEGMKLLCDLAGIECLVVTGNAVDSDVTDGHAWNIVKIDGDYYHLDVTNDDPVTNSGTEILTYSYFNLTDSEMMKAYTWNREMFPSCSSTKNSYYNKCNMIAESRETFDKVLTDELKKRSSVIELKVTDYSKNNYSNLSDLIFKTDIVMKYLCIINEDLGIIRIFDIKYFE